MSSPLEEEMSDVADNVAQPLKDRAPTDSLTYGQAPYQAFHQPNHPGMISQPHQAMTPAPSTPEIDHRVPSNRGRSSPSLDGQRRIKRESLPGVNEQPFAADGSEEATNDLGVQGEEEEEEEFEMAYKRQRTKSTLAKHTGGKTRQDRRR